MKIREIIENKLIQLYGDNADMLQRIGNLLDPDLDEIVDIFYAELMEIPEISPILNNSIVQKNLAVSQKKWIRDFLKPRTTHDIRSLTDRQKQIGAVHANINVNLNYFTHGISIMKREIYSRLWHSDSLKQNFADAFLLVGQLFDILVSLISEAYFSNEIIHETNELSLKMKGMNQNTALECERLRSLLFDWLRNALTFLYRTPKINMDNLPKLQYSGFGLWVIYKSDLISHTLNISGELKKHIQQIDDILFLAAKYKAENDQFQFSESITALNDEVSKASWFISAIVDQVMELDTGMDTLTRLFNRRYLDTILRRQTEISMRQELPFSILMLDIDNFKQINDIYGHESGDAVLKQFSELLLLSVRTSDFIFRFGGEEFLVVLGNVDSKEAFYIAEKIRHKCEEHPFRLPNNQQIHKTCSIGISSYRRHPDFNRIVKCADMALYEAKESGRNRVVLKEDV